MGKSIRQQSNGPAEMRADHNKIDRDLSQKLTGSGGLDATDNEITGELTQDRDQ